ncbi:glycine cleavage system aminomethyltransferase GcvT [Eubacteriales bacterium OttesenSCG-928-A19]|nr:glycine cleavage system aminomethyltransferase GcvT [Eubacteriales bacterium OttesenSCG-928-A19]
MQEAKRTPLYDNHIRLGGKMVEFGGWALPVQYSTILAEHRAVREDCGLFDVSHMGEVSVRGKGALAFLNRICTNSFDGMEIGRCRYSPMCYPDGGTVDDLIVYKRGEDDYLVIVNASNTRKDFDWMQEQRTEDITLENVSDQFAQLALQGPKYREVLARLAIEGELPEKPYTFVEHMRIDGADCLVSTTGYTGEPGVEIYLSPADAGRVFDRLVEAGAVPCGLGARDTLRFEASMPLYGHELDKDITPLECNLKAFVKLDKPDFNGKAPMETPRKRCRIGLELLDRGIAREYLPVLDEAGSIVGQTTSGGPAPTLGKNLAMAIVDVSAADSPAFFIEVRGRRLRAKRVPMPFYRSENK